VLHADDFLALMIGDGVPDGHVIGRQVQLVGAGQGGVAGERVRETRDRLVQQVKDRTLHRPAQPAAAMPRSPARTSPGSGRGGHSRIPHASASSSRVNAGASSLRPGSAWMRAVATPRPTSRRSRFSSAFSASSSARGMLTSSDASALTRLPQFGASAPV